MVLLNDFVRQWAEIRGDVALALEAVGASGHYILGPSVTAFEEQLGRFCGTRHVVGVGNGLDAIAIAGQAIVGRALGANDAELTRAASRRMLQWGVAVGLVHAREVTTIRRGGRYRVRTDDVLRVKQVLYQLS